MYARPNVNGKASTLGVSGMLWRDALIMYDRETQSLWSQVNGRAVAGPERGQRLTEVPSELTTWREWKRRHPGTLVLVKPALSGSPYDDYFADPERIGVRGSTNPDPRLPPKDLVLGLERRDRYAAVPLRSLPAGRVLNVMALGVPLVITPSSAFERRLDGRTLTFEDVDGTTIRDLQTQSRWSVDTGAAIDGALKGNRLERISAKVVYWGVWARFHARSEIVKGPARE